MFELSFEYFNGVFGYCRSSKAPDVFKQVYGSKIPVLEGENFSMRVLVSQNSSLQD